MVYQQQPQQQYGGQPQYGAQPPAQQYGAPAPQSAGMGMAQPPEIKWSGLETGGAFKIPVIAFIGRLTEIKKDYASQYGLRVVEKYDQVQILESPVPWPWATIDLSVKYSSKENSGWGHHVASAKALGIAAQAPTLDAAMAELVGKVYEMRQVQQAYGENDKGEPMHGDVWKFMRVVQPGMAQSFPQPQYAQPVQVTPSPAPAVGTVFQQPQQAVYPIPAPTAQPGPTPQAPAGFNPAISPADAPAVRAKKLLHGRALNEWLGAALIDDKIKADSSFINSIYDQSFIVGLKASGQVVQNPDGKFQVIS